MKKLPERISRELTQLETFSPHILEASLRGMNLNQIFRDFYRVNSPRFEGFRQLCHDSSKSFDIQMTLVHNDFMSAMMKIISCQLEEIGVDEETFVQACQGTTSPVPMKLIEFLESQAEFLSFGAHMEDRFHELFQKPRDPIDRQHVRVLWDIENIGVPRKKGGALDTITRLQNFLRSKSLFGQGIDCRFTAFFAPNNSSIPPKVIEELDKAAIELVWVSGKREDADRKLGYRISQEIHVLPPAQTVFVIISSDQDYRHHFQLLQNSGYAVIVIHDAKTDRWGNVMELQATEAYRWGDIIPHSKHKPHKKITSDPSSSASSCSASHSPGVKIESDTVSPSPEVGSQENHSESPPVAAAPVCAVTQQSESSQSGPPATAAATTGAIAGRDNESDWLTGVCTNWNKSYGFCQVSSGPTEFVKKDIFIHKSILPKECRGRLSRGDQVKVKAIVAEKGFQASHLLLFIPLPSHSPAVSSSVSEK